MKFSLESLFDVNQIQTYDNDHIVVKIKNSTELTTVNTSLILTPNQIITDKRIKDFTKLSNSEIFYLQNLEPEVLIIAQNLGTRFVTETQIKFSELAIGIECMSLGAACRTYNLLVAEGRKVVLLANFT